MIRLCLVHCAFCLALVSSIQSKAFLATRGGRRRQNHQRHRGVAIIRVPTFKSSSSCCPSSGDDRLRSPSSSSNKPFLTTLSRGGYQRASPVVSTTTTLLATSIEPPILAETEDSSGRNETETTEDLFPAELARPQYRWQDFIPRGVGLLPKLRWFVSGNSANYPSETTSELRQKLQSLARLLVLLREYNAVYGVPEFGGLQDQRQVLSSMIQDLYASGTPTWVLEPVLQRVAEGMTGQQGTQVLMLPNRFFIYFPQSSLNTSTSNMDLFPTSPGFDISRMNAVERVAVRLASFASNTRSVERSTPESFKIPSPRELVNLEQRELKNTTVTDTDNMTKIESAQQEEELAQEILDLASSTYGLFYFINNPKFQAAMNNATKEDADFWQVEPDIQRIFTRLATREAHRNMDFIRKPGSPFLGKSIMNRRFIPTLFRVLSSAGACAMWFGGAWTDMIVSGILAVAVNCIGSAGDLSFEERILAQVLSCILVGLVAGALALKWPTMFSFGAIAVSGVLDLLQGFKVVFAVIEVMSKNIVTGTSRLLEGVLFTGLISYSIKFGLDMAFRLVFGLNQPVPTDMSYMLKESGAAISQKLWPFMLPFAATAWSGLFRPSNRDLPLMAFHGILAFTLNWLGAPMFPAAMCVTFSAGVISRFTGREALGNTLAGLYAL
jgi:hypothetical protein